MIIEKTGLYGEHAQIVPECLFIQDVELNPVALRSADRDRREYAYSVPRFIRGAFFNTKLKRVDIVGFNIRREYRWLCRAEIRKI